MLLTLLLVAPQFPTDVPNPRRGEDPHSPYGYHHFGRGLANVGDLDGDGLDEFTVSDPYGSDPPTVWILSGADAHMVDRVSSDDCERNFGHVVAGTPDIDGDGVGEIAIAMPSTWASTASGCVRIYSGRTRALLRTILGPLGVARFGFEIAGLPDIDGDGSGDLLVGNGDSGSIRSGFVISGRTGVLLRELWRADALVFPRVMPIGDLDGDGREDIALTGTDQGSLTPIAYLSSPRDGRTLGVLRGTTVNPEQGVFAFTLGAQEHAQVMLLSNSVIDAFSVVQLEPLYCWRIQAVPDTYYEVGYGSVGDIDGDAVPDFVLADPEDGYLMGSVACRSGRTGNILWHEPPREAWRNVALYHMGRQIAVVGDFDRDGVRDFIWATDGSMNGNPGLVFLTSGKTGRAIQVLARGPGLSVLRLGPKG